MHDDNPGMTKGKSKASLKDLRELRGCAGRAVLREPLDRARDPARDCPEHNGGHPLCSGRAGALRRDENLVKTDKSGPRADPGPEALGGP